MTTHIPHLNEPLTPREKSVLAGIIAGEQTKQIARSLGIAPSTIAHYRKQIRTKLGAKNAADMVRIALTMKTQPQSNGVRR